MAITRIVVEILIEKDPTERGGHDLEVRVNGEIVLPIELKTFCAYPIHRGSPEEAPGGFEVSMDLVMPSQISDEDVVEDLLEEL